MLGKYNSRLLVVRLYCRLLDTFFKIIALFDKSTKQNMNCKRILLNNGAHLGDVLYTLRVASVIKKNIPDAYIGIVVGSWSYKLVEACCDIDNVYIVDHWKLNRNNIGIEKKIISYIKSLKKAIKQIKNDKYDVGIDCYSYYPCSVFLFYLARIPRRVGYTCNAGEPLLTDSYCWADKNQHMFLYQISLLKALGLNNDIVDVCDSIVKYRFLDIDDDVLDKYNIKREKYILIHVGTGNKERELQIDTWCKIISKLNKINTREIILLGNSLREYEHIQTILNRCGESRIRSLYGKLSILELHQVIRNSYMFIGLESFAGHIAAMYGTRQVSIMHGATNKYQWQPFNNRKCVVVRKKIYCSPCYKGKTRLCKNECMKIDVRDIFSAIKKIS